MGEESIKEEADPEVKDAALIAAARRVEHEEKIGYGTVRAFTNLLKEVAISNFLEQPLAEVKAIDKALSGLAESTINLEAK